MIVDCAVYRDGRRRDESVDLATAGRIVRTSDEGFTWIGVHEPTAEEFESVAREFALHPLAVEDAVKAHQRPKLETYGDTVFLVVKTAGYRDRDEIVDIGQLMLFIGERFVVSVRHGSNAALPEVRKVLEADPERLRQGPAVVLHAVLDRIVDDYESVLASLDTDVDEIEDEVFGSQRGNSAQRIYLVRRELSEFRRAVEPLATVLQRLSDGKLSMVDDSTQPYFRDVHDHLLRTAEHIDHLSGLLGSALDANLAKVSIQQNSDQRKISAWAAIGLVPTVTGAIYGMNFEHMPELDWRFGYPLVMTLTAIVCLTLYRAFKRSNWL